MDSGRGNGVWKNRNDNKFLLLSGEIGKFYPIGQNVIAIFLKKADHEHGEAIILAYSLYQTSLEDRITMGDLIKTLDSPALAQIKREYQDNGKAGDEKERTGKKERGSKRKDNIKEEIFPNEYAFVTDGDGKLEEKENKKIFLGLEEEERKQWKEKGKDGGKKPK